MFFSLKLLSTNKYSLQSRRYPGAGGLRIIGSGSNSEADDRPLKQSLLTTEQRLSYRKQQQQEQRRRRRHYEPPHPEFAITQGVTKKELARRQREAKAAANPGDDTSSLEDWMVTDGMSPIGTRETCFSSAEQFGEFVEHFPKMQPLLANELTTAACEFRMMGVEHAQLGCSDAEKINTQKKRRKLAADMGFVGDREVTVNQAGRLFPLLNMLLRHGWYHQLPVELGGSFNPATWLACGAIDPREFELRYVPEAYDTTYKRKEIISRRNWRMQLVKEQVENTIVHAIPAGLQLVKKAATDAEPDQVLCFTLDNHLKPLFQGTDRLENFGRFAQLADRCAELVVPKECDYKTAEFSVAQTLWDLGCDLEEGGGHFYRERLSSEAKRELPAIVGMKGKVKQHILSESEVPISALSQHASQREFKAKISARAMSVVDVEADIPGVSSSPTYEQESELSRSNITKLQQLRAKRFYMVSALSLEMYAKLQQAKRALGLLDELTRAVADAKISIIRGRTLGQAKIDWSGVNDVWLNMKAEGLVPHDQGTYNSLDLSAYLARVSEMIDAASALHEQLYGPADGDGILQRWGVRAEAKEQIAVSCVLARDAHAQMVDRVTHALVREATGGVIVDDLIDTKSKKLRDAAAVSVRLLRAGQAMPVRHSGRNHRQPEVISWMNQQNNFGPVVTKWDDFYAQDPRQLQQLKQALFHSNQFTDLSERIASLRDKYDAMCEKLRKKGKRPNTLSTSERHHFNFHLMGRAKAQGMERYLTDIAQARTIPELVEVFESLHQQLPSLHYTLHLLSESGDYAVDAIDLHMDQHRHGKFNKYADDQQPIVSCSTSMFGGMGARKTTKRMRKLLEKLEDLLEPHRQDAANRYI
ncbi:MAG: hypothetical protein P1U63_13295 [Coxiellaceae bacterium]|nr:hypothetical protein [Coxiellaceae bacterium]